MKIRKTVFKIRGRPRNEHTAKNAKKAYEDASRFLLLLFGLIGKKYTHEKNGRIVVEKTGAYISILATTSQERREAQKLLEYSYFIENWPAYDTPAEDIKEIIRNYEKTKSLNKKSRTRKAKIRPKRPQKQAVTHENSFFDSFLD
jgi:hypothetical protein